MSIEIFGPIIFIPFFLFSLWSYFNPEDSMLLFKRWEYRDVEFTDLAIELHKLKAIAGLFIPSIILLNLYYVNTLLNLILIICFVILGMIKLFRILNQYD